MLFLAAKRRQTAAEAWDDEDCEGWYYCEGHYDEGRQSLRTELDLIAVTDTDLADEVRKEGRCYLCWEGAVDAERAIYESDAVARMEESLRR